MQNKLLITFCIAAILLFPAVSASYLRGSLDDSKYTEIVRDGYGTSKTYVTTGRYTTDGYGSVNNYKYERYERDGYRTARNYKYDTYARDSYGSTWENKAGIRDSRYKKDGYGSTWDNQAGIRNDNFVEDGYGTSNTNRAGIAGSSYVKSGYGSGSPSSGLSGATWVKAGYYYRKPSYDTIEYHYDPVSKTRASRENSYWKVGMQRQSPRNYKYKNYYDNLYP